MHPEFLRTLSLVLMLLGGTSVAPAQQPSPPADAQQRSQQEDAHGLNPASLERTSPARMPRPTSRRPMPFSSMARWRSPMRRRTARPCRRNSPRRTPTTTSS